jgi:hypothetical protein
VNYETIKHLAKQTGRSIIALLALSPNNDPFYITPGQRKDAEWFAEIWRQHGVSTGVHNRRIHYWLVTRPTPVKRPNGSNYENDENCWNWLDRASCTARYLGLVSSDAFIDRRNPDPEIFETVCDDPEPETTIVHYDDWGSYGLPTVPKLPDLPKTLPDLPGYEVTPLPETTEQPFFVEIWCEKTGQNDVLVPICERYGVNYITGAGELSETACYRFLERVLEANKPARILYVSDFDPAGKGMPVSISRKIEFHQRDNPEFRDLDIRLEPIILTLEQVTQYNLPRIPVKDTDKRKANFEAVNGEGQVELDALAELMPDKFARIVTSAILRYRDLSLRERTEQAYENFESYLEYITDGIHSVYARQRRELQNEYAALYTEWQALRERFAELTAPFKEQIDTLIERAESIHERARVLQDEVLEHCEAHLDELDEYESPGPNLPVEPDGQLYDSRRDYNEQIDAYKRYKAGGAS